MNDLRSLADLRTTPLWQHLIVTQLDQIPPVDRSLPREQLDDRVHEIWRWKAWRDCEYILHTHVDPLTDYDQNRYDITRTLYERLRPALRLATILLDRTLPFFVRITRGTRNYPFVIPASWTPNDADYASLDADLRGNFAALYRIVRLDDPTARGYGLTMTGQGNDVAFICAISSVLLEEIEDDISWLAKNEMQKAAVLTLVATTLVHELAHALNRFMLITGTFAPGSMMEAAHLALTEPQVEAEGSTELGFSLERYLFGCELMYPWMVLPSTLVGSQSADNSVQLFDCSRGLFASVDTSLNTDRSQMETYHVAVETIMSFFIKQEWQQRRKDLYLFPIEDLLGNFVIWPYVGVLVP